MAALKKKNTSTDELAVIYACLILADDDIPITEDKINTILQAAEVKVEPIWPALFSKALESINIRQMITSVGAASAGGGDAFVSTDAPAPAEAPPEEEKKKPESEEEEDSDEDMGLSLFD